MTHALISVNDSLFYKLCADNFKTYFSNSLYTTLIRTNPKSFWLASIFTVVLICVFLSLVSVIMLLFSQPDRSEEPTEKEGLTICGHVDSCSTDGITKKLI